MLHRLILVISCLFGSLTLHAQDILNIQASVGVSIPTGHFSGDNLNDPRSGFAGVGGIINLHVGLKPTKNFGLCFYGAMAMYPAKTGNVESTVNTAYGTNIRASTGFYRFGMATGGFMFSGRVSEHFALDARITAGYLWAETPMLEMKENDIIYYKHYRTPGKGVAASGSFGFRYIIKRVWYVAGTADFIFGYPGYSNAIIETRNGLNSVTRQDSYNQIIGAVNITGGIGVSF